MGENQSKKVSLPLTKASAASLHAGDVVSLTGVMYSARDAAHARMTEEAAKMRDAGETVRYPFDLAGQVVYYLGPTPARPGEVIGSAGPTTASRMDKYTPELLDAGLLGMVGKGKRSPAVIEAMKRNGAVYFAAIGGAGALLSQCIKKSEVIAYDDLGTEAIREMWVEDFPAVVVIDAEGNNLYESAVEAYRQV